MTPAWRKEGWAPAGPGLCTCPTCGETVSTRASERAFHIEQCTLRRRNEQIQKCPRWMGGRHYLAPTETRCSCGFVRGMI